MSPFLYQKVFAGSMALLAVIMGGARMGSPDNTYQQKGSTLLVPLLLCTVLTLWMGLRPISGAAFGDTANYAFQYAMMPVHSVQVDWGEEWLWVLLMTSCKASGLSVHGFFLIVEIGYILSALWAVARFMPKDPMVGLVFLLNALMFFTFGTNGIRNGLACHLVLLGISFLYDDKWIPGAVVFLLAFGIHRSTALPVLAVLFSRFVNRDVRLGIIIWVSSIFLSLIVGGAAETFFANLGFDERMASYTSRTDMSEFSRAGFRWDFLLYSAMPVLMAWYVCIRKGVQDNWYNALCMTYCLCNAFWVLVIRSAFSNRFAYLSWFLYPIVIAYPLVNMDFREDQDRFSGYVMIAYAAFSVFMWFVFWR